MFIELPPLLSLPPVGGLLQTRFSGAGLFFQLPDVPFGGGLPGRLSMSRVSPAVPESSRVSPWPSFLLPAPPAEATVRTVGARRLGGPVDPENSVTLGKVMITILLVVLIYFSGVFLDTSSYIMIHLIVKSLNI